MANDDKDYFIPEQLDDNDFEKEKLEEKQARKEKKFKFDKKQSVKIIFPILFIVLLVVGIYLYLNPIQKKATAPEKAAKDFCSYFNSGNWKKLNQMMDFKGYYILDSVLKEADYTKFDDAYEDLDENDNSYAKFCDVMKLLINVDNEALDSYASVKINFKNVESCNLIQGTDTLYKLRVSFDYKYNGQTENLMGIIYISNASGEYKMIYGEFIDTVLNFYQSVYMMQSNYDY